jgi:hypothetical protein
MRGNRIRSRTARNTRPRSLVRVSGALLAAAGLLVLGLTSWSPLDAAPATHFSVSAPAVATAGTPFVFTVTALDGANTTDTAYAGTVHFTSSDGAATLPADVTLTNGTGTTPGSRRRWEPCS